MKKALVCMCVLALTLVFTMPALAATLFPMPDGNDVLVPDYIIKAIPGYDPKKPVYAASDYNGWFVRGKAWATDAKRADSQMRPEGDRWRARSLRGERFHPVQLDANEKPIWALLEDVIDLDHPTVNNKGKGPCLQVK